MTVNINTSTPNPGSTRKNTAPEIQSPVETKEVQRPAETLNKLSSGVALPEQEPQADSSEISTESTEKSTTASIADLQEEANQIEAFQGVLEEVADDIWSIEEQVSRQQSQPEDPQQMQQSAPQAPAVQVAAAAATEETQARAEPEIADDMSSQEVVDSRLADIDDKGGELLQYMASFREAFMTNIEEINSRLLGRVQEDGKDYSLDSLSGSVALNSQTAQSVVQKAQEDISEIQVSTETSRNNILNEINNTLGEAISNLENPANRNSSSIDNSIAEVSSMLLNSPAAFNGANGIDSSKVASLLF